MSDMNDYGFESEGVRGGGPIRLSKKTIGELELDAKDAAIIRGLEKELEEDPPIATNPVTTEELEGIIESWEKEPFVAGHLVDVREVKVIEEDTREYDNEGNITTHGAISRLKGLDTFFLTGVAGSGKSYLLNRWIEQGDNNIELVASTGIAAVNLNSTTIHSRLGFYNTQSLVDSYVRGRLLRNLERIASKVNGLVLDELSMFGAKALDTIMLAVKEMNKYRAAEGKKPFVFGTTGDFLQLPVVPDKNDPSSSLYAFEGDCWEELFEPNTIRLTKVWRQSNPLLLEALNHIRVGRGSEGVECLVRAGVEFTDTLDANFQGTTIFPTNKLVDNFNDVSLLNLKTEKVRVSSERWYKGQRQPNEWENNIPSELTLKLGAYVMILANDSPAFTYANGDCGWLEAYDEVSEVATIRLARNGQVVRVPKIVREDITSEWNSSWYGCDEKEVERRSVKGKPVYTDNKPYFNTENKKYIKGQCRFLPLRLAYATSNHKVQGLSLDRVQIDISHSFFGSPGMIYVSLSRAKTLEGLRVKGSPKLLAERVKCDERVKRFA